VQASEHGGWHVRRDKHYMLGAAPSNPMMHRTCSVDYAILMSGEIDVMLDTGTVHVEAGEVIVQQATNHA
jgi:mannose-6-phosphate isomerase-like protein (cupin superfamily)